jgi:hypothetical protein
MRYVLTLARPTNCPMKCRANLISHVRCASNRYRIDAAPRIDAMCQKLTSLDKYGIARLVPIRPTSCGMKPPKIRTLQSELSW